jgi:hypothetical protein
MGKQTYRILSRREIWELEEAVDYLLDKWYKCQWWVSVIQEFGSNYRYLQAMIKE